MIRVNQIINILVKKIQIIKKVKTIKIQKTRIINKLKTTQKMKIVKKLKTIEIHLHSMKWKFIYNNNWRRQLDQEKQLNQWFSTVQLESLIFYIFWML